MPEQTGASVSDREKAFEAALRSIAAIKPDPIQWVEFNHARLRKAVAIARNALEANRAN